MKIKSILTAAIVLTSVLSIQAQDKKMWVGGALGLWMSKVNENDAKLSFKIEPEFGFAFNKNMAVWGSIGYIHTENDRIESLGGLSANGYEANGVTFSSYFRYSFMHGNVGFLFLDGGVGYTHLELTSSSTDNNFLRIGVTPGVGINLNDHLAVTGRFGFFGYQYFEYGSSTEDEFGLDLNFKNFYFGFIFKF